MLYHLLYPLQRATVPVLNVTRYITFRTAAASLTALAISLLLGPWMIRKLREFQIGQVIRQEGPQTHRTKAGTPTMGGLLILTAALVPTLLWADLTNAVRLDRGAGDRRLRRDRLRRRLPEDRAPHRITGCCRATRWRWQIARRRSPSASCCSCWRSHDLYNTRLIFPFFKRLIPDLGWLLPAVRGVRARRRESNAVNLTDGLDGLAISMFAIAAAAFTALAYVIGHRVFADYLLLVRFPPGGGADDLLRRAGRRVPRRSSGTTRYPAEIFMGDVGSLALGGALGTVAHPHQAGAAAADRRRRVRARGAVGDHPGRLVQADRQARLQDGAAPPPLRADRLERAEGHRALRDRRRSSSRCSA